jgi:hypothetical protein
MMIEGRERENRLSIIDQCVDDTDVDDDTIDDERIDDDDGSSQIKITARQVREAHLHGEIVDLDWALKQRDAMLCQRGQVTDVTSMPLTDKAEDQRLNLPPEELPLASLFSRSYSYLTVHPDNIGIRDLPKLLNEYKMLVHVTELLLNERNVWRESERKRQSRLEREHLERVYADIIAVDENGASVYFANGHCTK